MSIYIGTDLILKPVHIGHSCSLWEFFKVSHTVAQGCLRKSRRGRRKLALYRLWVTGFDTTGDSGRERRRYLGLLAYPRYHSVMPEDACHTRSMMTMSGTGIQDRCLGLVPVSNFTIW